MSNVGNDCPMCAGTGWERLDGNGRRGVRKCLCALERQKQQFLSRIPARYRSATLQDLEPCNDHSLCFSEPELQAQVIAHLKAQPDDSYAFFGPPGFGKSYYLAALYRHAVETQGIGCYFVQAAELVRSFRAEELGDEIRPYLSIETLRECVGQGRRPRIYIDEFERLPTFSQFVWAKVSEFVDEMYRLAGQDSRGLQLVLASNLTRAEFADLWGSAVLRRIEGVCAPMDFFAVGTERSKNPDAVAPANR